MILSAFFVIHTLIDASLKTDCFRGDHKPPERRCPIAAKIIAGMLETAGTSQVQGNSKKGSGDDVLTVCYTNYISRCTQTAETTSPEPFS